MIDAGLDEDYKELHADFSTYYWKRIEDQKIFQKYLQHRYGKVDYVVLAHAILAYRKENAKLLKTYPGAIELLEKLRKDGWKLALLSDAPKLEAYMRLCSLGLERHFDVILTKDDIGTVKPNQKGFRSTARKLRVDPRQCVMVGDRDEKDIAGAQRVGMTTIHAAYGDDGESSADYTVYSLKELGDVLASLRKKDSSQQ
jgi:putative hydrolase of the HAD superfamily